MSSSSLSYLDYELPESLIAQAPLADRSAARLLAVGDAAVSHHRVVDLPQLLPPALIVVNEAKVLQARLQGHKTSGGAAELLLIEPCGDGAEISSTREIAATKSDSVARSHDGLGHGKSPESPPLEAAREASDTAERWRALGRASRAMAPGTELVFGEGRLSATVVGREGRFYLVDLKAQSAAPSSAASGAIVASTTSLEAASQGQAGREPTVLKLLEEIGTLPLPPYIKRPPRAQDRDDYQTMFAKRPGAVAAPTAGLHFSPPLVRDLLAAGHQIAKLTLHVGPGTFRPVSSTTLEEHEMHSETFEVGEECADAIAAARREGRPILAVGTTVVRTLEAVMARYGEIRPVHSSTDLFIYPPYEFRVVDMMMTNFHLPKSTLLALVMAFAGPARVRAAYASAVAAGYRFFSYGDAMLLPTRDHGKPFPC